MNKLIIVLSVITTIAGNIQISAQDSTYGFLKRGFNNPPDQAHPKVYWWCLNGNIDTVRAKQEFIAMKNAGITGFDMFEIGVPAEDKMIPGGPAFLSDESLKVIKFVVNEAGRLGLQVGLNLASSWNAGGSWILPENAGKSLYFSKINVKGGPNLQRIKIPFPVVSAKGNVGKSFIYYRADGRPVYYEDVVLLAIPANLEKHIADTSKIINISGFFDSVNDLLTWKVPPGDWDIYRYVCSNSGQQLVLPSPHSAGLTIDHFDSVAVRTHLMYIINRLKPVLGDFRNTALKSFYLASYEARGFVWTPTFPSEFRKINGYDIYEFIPSLFDKEMFNQEITDRIQTHFKRTLSELMINNLYKTARRICNSYGLKINCEAGGPGYPLYNGPAEPLKALGALDIPRGEFWVKHSRYYMDEYSKDSIDILRVVKEVAAASHIYNSGISEEESFTSFQHWQEGPFDLKPIGDRAFCEGMNRVVFHGFSHNPDGTGSPGIVYHAGTHFNDKRIWWTKVNPFIEYLSRVSYIAQETGFVADVLYYYGDKIPNSVTPKNTQFAVGPGYDYEVVNTEILLDKLKVKDGKLMLPNGETFSLLALKNEEAINPLVLVKLNELANQGALITGSKPGKVMEFKNQPDTDSKYHDLIDQLWMDVNGNSGIAISTKGKVFSGIKPVEILRALDIPPDVNCSDKEDDPLDYIHYKEADVDFYFVTNTSDKWVSRKYGFRQQSKIPEIWNPLSGEAIPVQVYNEEEKEILIPLTLAPYGSYFVVFRKGVPSSHYTNVIASDQHQPLMEFTQNGLLFLNDGIFKLEKKSESKMVEIRQKIQPVDGEWKIFFKKGWGAPDSAIFPELASWTSNKNEGIKYYSGTGTYYKTFLFMDKTDDLKEQRIFLDLGELSKVAEVWLNEKSLGIIWAKPFKIDITDYIKNGENKLTVEVANVWSNRLTGDALTGEKYTSTNITGNGDNLTPWANVPLIESGLLGPVTIKTVNLVK
jgi:hypothetical protein